MSVKMQHPVPPNALASSDPTVAFIVLVCAVLIGSSAGFLVADREGAPGQKGAGAGQSKVSLAGQPSQNDSADMKAGAGKPKNSKEGRSAARSSNGTLQPAAFSLDSVHYSEQPDSASVNVDLGALVLVRTEKIHNPERIYFDLRDSRRTEGAMDALGTRRTVRTDGNLVARVRASEESGVIRLVLDLKRDCDYTYRLSPEPSPHLLVRLDPGVGPQQSY